MTAQLSEFSTQAALNTFIAEHGWDVRDIQVIVTDIQQMSEIQRGVLTAT